MSLHNCSIKTLSSKLGNFPVFEGSQPAAILKKLHFFSAVDEGTLEEISDSICISELSADEVICRHGMFDKRFYLILSGEVKAVIPTEHDARYEIFRFGPGDFFGEEILFSTVPRENTIMAVRDTLALSLPRHTLEKLVSMSESIKALMDDKYIERKLETDLRRVPVFTSLSDELFTELLNKVELLALPKGRKIFSAGEEGDAFYLIRNGKVNVLRMVGGEKKLVSMLGQGQFFGETSLLLKEKRNAAVEVSENAELVKISREAFVGIVEKDQGLLKEFQEIIIERKRVSEDALSNPKVAIVTRKLLDLDNIIYRHIDVISHCTVDTKSGSALLATLPGSRYPYVYPRDSACASRFLYKLAVGPLKSGDFAFKVLEDIASFILNCQREDGHWGQRYGTDGQDKSIYKQEDNVAHGVIILCRYLLASKSRRKSVPDVEKIIAAIAKGSGYARKNYYRNEIHLFFSTTSVHESAIEEGYSIWVNYAYFLMLRLMDMVRTEYGVLDRFSEEMALRGGFESNIENVFSVTERFVRRLKPNGDVDLRPDVTLMSPFYFCAGVDIENFKNTEKFTASIKFIEQTLWDPDLGLLQRYLPFNEDPHTHVHAGSGPWLPYTSMLAQYYFYIGEKEKGDAILEAIDEYSSREGHLCEHLTTPQRFYEFKEMEFLTGRDFEKELSSAKILLPGIPHDLIIEELNHMKNAYDAIERECRENGNRGYITFATPLMWAHAEYAMALILRTEKELENLDETRKQ